MASLLSTAFRNSSSHGASVFALSNRGATSEAARWLAQRANSDDLIGVDFDSADRVLRSVLIDLSQTATISSSLRLGANLLSSIKRVARLHNRKVEQAAFVVLKSPDIPSVLIETGFISNLNEERHLTDPYFQEKMANAIVRGIQQYFAHNAPRGTYLAVKKK